MDCLKLDCAMLRATQYVYEIHVHVLACNISARQETAPEVLVRNFCSI